MCDFSIKAAKSHPATVGEKLVTHGFGWGTTGFAEVGTVTEDRYAATAVCLLPGTELAFDEPVAYTHRETWTFHQSTHKVARFRQINKDQEKVHHDAIEFPDGEQVLLTALQERQNCTVLQLPATPKSDAEVEDQKRLAYTE